MMARKHGAEVLGSMAWKELRLRILERDGWHCKICRGLLQAGDGSAHVDHIVPRDQGGPTTPGNLQALCRRCNLIKSRSEASQAALRRRGDAAGQKVATASTPQAGWSFVCKIHGTGCGATHSRAW
jgi:5-methylcytosine-specific restriction endonuclease McrA